LNDFKDKSGGTLGNIPPNSN